MYSRAYVRIWTLRYPDSANVPISSKKKKQKNKKNASSKYTYSVLFWLEDYLKQLRDLYLPGVCDLAMVSILDT